MLGGKQQGPTFSLEAAKELAVQGSALDVDGCQRLQTDSRDRDVKFATDLNRTSSLV